MFVLIRNLQGFVAVGCMQDRITILLQELADQIADSVLVFHHQNGFRSTGSSGTSDFCFRNRFRLGLVRRNLREIDFESGAVSHLTASCDPTAGLFNNPVDDGQAQAGSLARFLSSEKRFEDARLHFTVHPNPSVAHAKNYVLARRDAGMASAVS